MVVSQVSDGDSEFRGFSWLLQEVYRGVLQDSGTHDTAGKEGPTVCMD